MTALFASPSAAAPATGWTAPWQLESALITVSDLHVELLPGGGAVALWVATPSTTSFLASSRYTEGAGWSQPTYTRLNGFAMGVVLDVNSAGDGVATWLDWTTGGYAYASFFHPDGGFAPASAVYETQGNYQGYPTVAIDESGTATLLFAEWNGSAYNAFFVRGSAATGAWGAPLPLPVSVGSAVQDHAMAVRANATGAVFAVWQQGNATGNHLFGSVFTSAWSAPQRMDTNTFGVFSDVNLQVLADGRAAAAWSENNATGIFAPVVSAYSPGSGWQPDGNPLPLAYDMGTGGYDLACADSGRCVAAWADSTGTHGIIAFAVSEDAGVTFGAPVFVEPSLEGGANRPDVSLTPQGDGILAWVQPILPPGGTPPNASTFAAQITPAGTLAPAQRLDGSDSQNAVFLITDASADGTRLVVWFDSSSMKTAAWASLYHPADSAPPSLRVTAPLANAVINGTSTVVQGVAEPGATVSVNGALALVRANGSFAIRVPLPPGPNVLRVSAWDAAGNNVTVLVDITVVDPATALAAQLDAANLTIVYLSENVTTIEENNTELRTEFTILIQHVNDMETGWNLTREQFLASQNASSANATRAEANATAAHEATHMVQQRLDGTQSELNTTKAALASSQASISSAQSAASTAMLVGVLAIFAGIAGIVMAIRNPSRTAGVSTARQTPKTDFGERAQAGASTPRQTPKTDFGDRMKAGLDTAGGIAAQGAGPRQTTSQDGSFGRAAESGGSSGQDLSLEGSLEEEEEEEEDEEGEEERKVHGVHHGEKPTGVDASAERGPRQSTSVDGSYSSSTGAADAKYGAVAGAHRYDEFSKATGRASGAPPRDAASGQASGKRSYDPSKEYLPGDTAVFNDQAVHRDSATGQASGKREAAAPRDAASGQATGKRQATGDLDGDGARERGGVGQGGGIYNRGPRQSTDVSTHIDTDRDSGTGQASGKRSSMAGEYARDAASGQATGKFAAEAPQGTHHEVKAPRDLATGQASGKQAAHEIQSPRDLATGQASGKQAAHEIQTPRDAASGQASGKSAEGGGGGGGSGGSEGSTAKEQLKKNPRN